MTAIDLRRRQVPSIGSMSDVVWVCTTTERPDEDVSTIVERPGVFKAHARIRNIRPDVILDFQAVFGTEEPPPTTEITIRYPPDVKIDLNHWVYRVTGDALTWYKVRDVEDMGQARRFLILRCNIDVVNDRRNDPMTQRPPPVWENPNLEIRYETRPCPPPGPEINDLRKRLDALERCMTEVTESLKRIEHGQF